MAGIRAPENVVRNVPDNVSTTESRGHQAARLGDFQTELVEDVVMTPDDERKDVVFENTEGELHYVGHASCEIDTYGHTFNWGVELRDEEGSTLAQARTNLGSQGFMNFDPPWPVRAGQEIRLIMVNNMDVETVASGNIVMWSDPGSA